MRTGYENGYRVFTVKDCVAATSQAEHDNAISYDFPMFSIARLGRDSHRSAVPVRQ
jgi:nicotinamidase-related amidase